MEKARTNTYMMYTISTFDGKAKCNIHCCPQQRWDVVFNENKKQVILNRQNVSFTIPKKDFDENWTVLE